MKAAGRLRRWLGDSLFKRLFVLMWAALVLSHVAAFAVVMLRHGGWLPGGPLPTFPSLPPTPGLPDSGAVLHGALQPPPHAQASAAFAPPGGPGPLPGHDDADGDWAAPAFPPGGGAEGFRFGGLPAADLALDYGVRLLVIALAAWWGVREAAQVFNAMALQLQQQFRARTLLMGSVSHDVRTPLTRLRLRLERLERPEDAPLVHRCIADLREIDALVESALELTRSEQAQEAPRSTDLAALVS